MSNLILLLTYVWVLKGIERFTFKTIVDLNPYCETRCLKFLKFCSQQSEQTENQVKMAQDSSSSSSSSESSSNRSASPLPLPPKPTRRTNLQSSYKPPLGYKVLNEINEFKVSSLDLSKVKNESNDLWIIRLPPGLRSKHLENLKLDLKELSKQQSSRNPMKIKEVVLGNNLYEVFVEELSSQAQDSTKSRSGKLEPESLEVSKLSTLVPNNQGNRSELVQSTKPVSKVLFFRRKVEVELPTVNPIQQSIPSNPKRIQPIALETRLVPYGAQTDGVSYQYPLRSEEDEKIREINLGSKRAGDRALKSSLSHKKKVKVEK